MPVSMSSCCLQFAPGVGPALSCSGPQLWEWEAVGCVCSLFFSQVS